LAEDFHLADELQSSSRAMSYFRSLAGVVFVSLAVGCAGASSAPTAPSTTVTVGQLDGTWNLVSIQLAGQGDQAAPSGATYTLTFAQGRLSTRVDCNVCGGEFALSGVTLTAGPALACTRAACPTMAFENEYTRLLGGSSVVTLSRDTLVLSSERGVMRFRRSLVV
jgi:heat shock protein HslJ